MTAAVPGDGYKHRASQQGYGNTDADPGWVAAQATKFFVEAAGILNQNDPSNPGPGERTYPSGEETDWLGFAMGDEIINPGGSEPNS